MATPETFDESHRSEAKVLDALMGMLKASRGPLHSEQLARFKRDVIAHPGILSMASTDKPDELCTLLHHAAAGPAQDRRLVEWLIQMGVLGMESPHCRLANIMPQLESFSNMLAVHCAAKKGLTEIVKLILHGGNMRDLDTPTYRTKESLMHIAVKTGNRELFDWLTAMGADVSGKDASGKRVWNLTTDPSFRAHIMFVNDFQSKQKNRMKARLERGHGIYKGAAQEASEDSDIATATKSIQELLVSTASEALDDKVVQLEDALNKVKQGASVSRQQREASAEIALRIISEIEAVVQRDSMLRRVSSTASLDRELLSAARAVFLLDAYHQQLPTQDPTSSTREPTNIDKLNAKAGSNANVVTFELFMMFACAVAMSLRVCGHKSRAEDVFQLIERRLLAIQYRGETFRSVIEEYVGIRKMAKISPALGSTHDAQTHFKWYASNQGIGNKALLEALDCHHGARFYVCMFVQGGWNTSAAVRCTQLINSSFRHGRGVVYFDEFAFMGTDTTDQVADFVRTVLRAAQDSGLRVNMQSSVIGATELPLFNFVCSATGILPNDHSNCRYCTH